MRQRWRELFHRYSAPATTTRLKFFFGRIGRSAELPGGPGCPSFDQTDRSRSDRSNWLIRCSKRALPRRKWRAEIRLGGLKWTLIFAMANCLRLGAGDENNPQIASDPAVKNTNLF